MPEIGSLLSKYLYCLLGLDCLMFGCYPGWNFFVMLMQFRLFCSGLILLKMLSEYIDMNHSLPALSSEIVLRVVEVLRFFNTRTCQLVLGAGAMQV